jgi:hypothetical protein
MTELLESYMWGDPADVLDRKRASEAARAKRKLARDADRAGDNRRSGLTEEDMKLIPKTWFKAGGGK